MNRSANVRALLFAVCLPLAITANCHAAGLQEGKPPAPPDPKSSTQPLKKYTGRYELETGIIPISTLDVTLDNGELWLKPSVSKKRRLLQKSDALFIDEIGGGAYTFNSDERDQIVSLTFQYEGADYTAHKIALPPPSLKGNTTFRLQGFAKANVVALSGSFNNWDQSQFIFGREGDEWVCRIDLAPGTHVYKFIVDGKWMLDPANPNTQADDYGTQNSVVIVTRASSQ